MASVEIHGRLNAQGPEIEFRVQADNVELPNEMYRAAGYAAAGAVTTLAVVYGFPYFKSLIEGSIERAFAGADQTIKRIFTGSLHVVLHCCTAERFLEVLADYELGKIKERLEKEFSKSNFKVEGLKLEIANMTEVQKRKEAIEIERLNEKVMEMTIYPDNLPSDKMASSVGRMIKFIIQVNNVELSEGLRKYGKYVAVDGATTLAVLYREKRYQALILAVIHNVFRGDDQKNPQINTESQHVSLYCSTNARFLAVLKDHESGKITESLEKEFSEFGFNVEGLKVEIENKEEVYNKMEALLQKSLRIIVQGGVFAQMPEEMKNLHITTTKEAAKRGYALLKEGRTAVDAVEAAVRVFEKDEIFNAGYGSSLNDKNEVECDAMIMEGHTLRTGAVISGRHFRHPVSIAKTIMNESIHCALSGNGAKNFAEKQNFPICEPEELINEHAKVIAKWVDRTHNDEKPDSIKGPPDSKVPPNKEPIENVDNSKPSKMPVSQENWEQKMRRLQEQNTSDTVSAVAMDVYGHLACAMSTGGLSGKLEGRVSDVGMIGCGGYANKTGAATVTGFGESIMKVTLAREVVFRMEMGHDAQVEYVTPGAFCCSISLRPWSRIQLLCLQLYIKH